MLCFLLFLLLLFSSIYYCHHCLLIIKSGDGGHRSHCPFHAKEMLYHLSYIPIPILCSFSATSFNRTKEWKSRSNITNIILFFFNNNNNIMILCGKCLKGLSCLFIIVLFSRLLHSTNWEHVIILKTQVKKGMYCV